MSPFPNDDTLHHVLKTSLTPPYPEGLEIAEFALGCFWGAERRFWTPRGVWTTAVGYEGGHVDRPTYEIVCGEKTGHAETVRVVYDPDTVSYETLLRVFWESHDPTQGMRQGEDEGTRYRSVIFTRGEKRRAAAEASRDRYQALLSGAGFGPITTEIVPASVFHLAELYHQQYLAKNPDGYCGLGGTGVACAA